MVTGASGLASASVMAAPGARRGTRPSSRRRRIGRCGPVAVRASTSSPGGGKLVGGNRPTSPKAWQIQFKALTENNVRSVASSDIEKLVQARGAVILDIRPANEFSAGHLEASVNAPLYQPIEGWSLQQTMRKATFAFFGIFNGTEANENFEQEVRALADPDDEVVLVCNTGGTLDKNQKSQARSQSRSLMAAYEMIGFGYKKLRFLEGGYNQWCVEEREVIVTK
mmetsp:Transcript_8752/g.26390  ORF Transcript_8752/g.26390 Transcript_8752/m.26390 type:complete len:225 (+) Transcript_8752:31-705(+)